MADRQSSTDTPVYDLLGVGFGPANLSLAAVLEESGDTPEAREHGEFEHLFLESKPGYAWHPNMLLEDSLLQITVLKDLVTIHNPMSELTFLNYLKEKGRLFDWLNLRELYPTRLEFNDYLGWAAGKLDHRVRYNHEVEAVHAVEGDGGEVEMLRVVSRNGATGESEEHLARNVVVATGGRPVTPQGIDLPPDGKAFQSTSRRRSRPPSSRSSTASVLAPDSRPRSARPIPWSSPHDPPLTPPRTEAPPAVTPPGAPPPPATGC